MNARTKLNGSAETGPCDRWGELFFNGEVLSLGMFRTHFAQTSSSILVFGSFASAELAVRLLDAFPASRLVWYTNLAVFSPFERCRAVPSPLGAIVGPGTLSQSLALVGLALVAHAVRFRFGVAVMSHLSLAASAWLAYAWSADDVLGRLSLTTLQIREEVGTCLVLLMLAISSVGCALSHRSFVRAIRSDTEADIRSPGVASGTCTEVHRGSRQQHRFALQIT